MSSTNRTTKIKSLFTLLKKQTRESPKIKIQNILETLIYSACLENATFEQADGAFSVLEYHFIDWNEVRVSTAKELADVFQHLPDPLAAGDRIRKALQGVFETTYMFDLEEWKKKPLSQAIESLRNLPQCTPFMIDYTIQSAFGGHAIALDESALRVFRLLGLAQTNKDNTKEEVPGLERTISKQDGPDFSTLLHQFAVPFFLHETPEELKAVLKPIDPQSEKRDWTAPVLQTIKPVKPEKPIIPVTPLPDVSTLDEEDILDDEAVAVKELDFIPNPITGEEMSSLDDEKDAVTPGKTGKKETAKKKESKKETVTEKKEPEKPKRKKGTPQPDATEPKTAEQSKEKKSKEKPKTKEQPVEEPTPGQSPVRKLRQKKPK